MLLLFWKSIDISVIIYIYIYIYTRMWVIIWIKTLQPWHGNPRPPNKTFSIWKKPVQVWFKLILYIRQPQNQSDKQYKTISWEYRKASNIRHTKYQNLNVFRIVLQLSLRNLLKPGVQWRMMMHLEQRRHAILQLHLSDQQCYCLLRCDLY